MIEVSQQRIADDLDRAEAELGSLAETLAGRPEAGHVAQLEAAARALYGAGAGLTLAEVMGPAPAPELQARRAEAEETVALIGAHLAGALGPGEIPARLRAWHAEAIRTPVRLPPIPERVPRGDWPGYLSALSEYLNGLSPPQRAAIGASDLGLPETVIDAVMTAPPPSTEEMPEAVPLTMPLFPMIAEIFGGTPIGAFTAELAAEGRILCDREGAVGYAFSIAPDYGGLPFVYVPLDGTYRDLIQACHHIGHGYHHQVAQRCGTVLNPIGPDIDEIIPLCCELRCEAWLAGAAPEAARWLRARRRLEVAQAVDRVRRDAAIVAAARGAGPLPDLPVDAMEGRPGFRPAPLHSYALGSLVAERLWQRHGWDADRLRALAEQADAARLDALLAA